MDKRQEIKRRRSLLMKPFKSPKKQEQPTSPSASLASPAPPAPPASPAPPAPPAGHKRPAPETTTPLRSLLQSKKRRSATPHSSLGKRPPSLVSLRDEQTQRLAQEKTSLQRQLAQTKEEIALIERASALVAKNEAVVVDALVAKWQIACASACEDLFELLKPVMEAQRQAAEMGGGWGSGHVPDEKKSSAGGDDASDASDDDGSSVHSADGVLDGDINTPYMLRQFGIAPGLF
ncbi:hypothetical protein GGI25_005455 [Coemansia spiralis]|uniref:Swi5-dependent recombination DNA repair protein 1 n=2 Tax=Coemansia TaxID=4863 RepID=A0A9W8KW43_9FUNG|nr:hypothetical protein BX070DRAFT_233605 [Coemansia spiralis]KAJ1988221.1 hypothetical protein EDC05_005421 [Coemansia umbellata]KAJ2619630.1 hypothetical protein GGI26_005684 [Coemansia sp. RSA 1358]KAJ2671588.1 hypothetical protein GGI25_005455 [Coemansia spiralis]